MKIISDNEEIENQLAREASLNESEDITLDDTDVFQEDEDLDVFEDEDTDTLYEAIEDMFIAGADNIKIRGLNISYGSLGEGDSVQLSLFEDQESQIERSRLNDALDSIHRMFGDNSALRASALLERSTAMRRNEQIGGHRR